MLVDVARCCGIDAPDSTVRRPQTQQVKKQSQITAVVVISISDYRVQQVALPRNKQHTVFLAKPHAATLPYDFQRCLAAEARGLQVDVCVNERALLSKFFIHLKQLDPDVVVGHEVEKFGCELLMARATALKCPQWSFLGRPRRGVMPKLKKQVFAGRLLCDVAHSARELVRCRSYDLTELAAQILKVERCEPPNSAAMFDNGTSLVNSLKAVYSDAQLCLQLTNELQVLPLSLEMSQITGTVWSRTLLGGRSERNEWLLLHAFSQAGFIPPEKAAFFKATVAPEDGEEGGGGGGGRAKRSAQYEGGLVLSPKVGFYDTFILLLDFNSLYPSIMQEYNVCFSTTQRQDYDDESPEGLVLSDQGALLGVLPSQIRKLVQTRREVKKKMQKVNISAEAKIQLDIQQKALKLTANSMYGCLGFANSRFYAKPLAALITSKGREILMATKEMAEKLGLDVVYGDTDSIMVNTSASDFSLVHKLANQVKTAVNSQYRHIELGLDDVYAALLLLKKKKYAALKVLRQRPDGQLDTELELKGLDIVRRDWCPLAKGVGRRVVETLLSGKPHDEIVTAVAGLLETVVSSLPSRPLQQFVLTKGLTHNPEEYKNPKALIHVQVALRHNATDTARKYRAGDTVAYVVCDDGSKTPALQRAFTEAEYAAGGLQLDMQYYIANQLQPVITRLCEPVAGLDACRIASLLGLDTAKFEVVASRHPGHAASFSSCDPFSFTCPQCNSAESCDKMWSDGRWGLQRCTACSTEILPAHLPAVTASLNRTIRSFISRYYQQRLKCEDAACSFSTRHLPLQRTATCPACRQSLLQPEFSHSQLQTQLSFYAHLFDVKKAGDKAPVSHLSPALLAAYSTLRQLVAHFTTRSGFGVVQLENIFQGLKVAAIRQTPG